MSMPKLSVLVIVGVVAISVVVVHLSCRNKKNDNQSSSIEALLSVMWKKLCVHFQSKDVHKMHLYMCRITMTHKLHTIQCMATGEH